ncbi:MULTISPECIES: hypothetical protein [unclassified Clostridium]|uniref:hypothetical protein n=1 Tax=Clostridium TaxID=1485 RepID=UPI001C8BF63F|nr:MULTISPECIES: hypothetical protein [unclassified Clostridium]MBX9136809.1 hypothetical protein [Clostridium sp. K12(2020)]MBX9143619.1 hypothetical protein [Clostridium sp. K13]MDU2289622.1 hypothetical protein [Clostridium celatum]
MDNVLNIEKCKICGGLINIEGSLNKLTKICTCCGYFYNKENKVEYLNPCGAYKLVTLSGIGQIGTLGENITEEQAVKKFNLSDTSRLNMDKSYINYRNPQTNEFKIIFGSGEPESYNEFIRKL